MEPPKMWCLLKLIAVGMCSCLLLNSYLYSGFLSQKSAKKDETNVSVKTVTVESTKLLTYAVVKSVLNKVNNFGMCDRMRNIYTEGITLIKPLKLVYCPIAKNMNTQMWALIARTYYNRSSVLDDRKGLDSFWTYRETHYLNPHVVEGIFTAANTSVDGTFQNFVIIRHPFERFISAFYHQCWADKMCNRTATNFCNTNMICLLKRIEQLQKSCMWTLAIETSVELIHFAPQVYFCLLRKFAANSTVVLYSNTEEFRQNLTDFMVRKGIPKDTIYSGWGSKNTSWLNSTTFHQTSDSFYWQRKRIMNNILLLKLIFRVYRVDFKMFKFTMPPVVNAYCKHSQNLQEPICQYLNDHRPLAINNEFS